MRQGRYSEGDDGSSDHKCGHNCNCPIIRIAALINVFTSWKKIETAAKISIHKNWLKEMR
jgi:hypothetical protein